MPLVFVLYALFASVFTISKTGLGYTAPFFFVGTRMILAGILMLGYQYFRNPAAFQWKVMAPGRLFRLAFFNIYLTNACEFWGLKYLTSFKTCFFYSLSPFLSAFFSYLIFSEKMTSKKWVGLIVGFLGLGPILLTQSGAEEEAGRLLFFSWAEACVIIAAASSVYGWILLRQLVNENRQSPVLANGWSMLIGGIFALANSLYAENWNPIPVTEVVPFLECAFLLIVISNLVCYNLYGYLLQRFTATFMSFAGLSTPLFTAFFGWFFLNEVVGWPFYLSMTIVSLGLLVFYQEEIKQGYMISSESL